MSGTLFTIGDVSFNRRLFVNGDISCNGNLKVNYLNNSIPSSAIIGGVGGSNGVFTTDISGGNRLFINGTSIFNDYITVNNKTMFKGISLNNNNRFLLSTINLQGGNFNPITVSGDGGLFYSDYLDSASNKDMGFVIAPNKTTSSGMRMDGSGNITFTGGVTLTGGLKTNTIKSTLTNTGYGFIETAYDTSMDRYGISQRNLGKMTVYTSGSYANAQICFSSAKDNGVNSLYDDYMVINGAAKTNPGYVGIGTTSPSYKLDVNGIIRTSTNGGMTDVLITDGEIKMLNTGYSHYSFFNTSGGLLINNTSATSTIGTTGTNLIKVYNDGTTCINCTATNDGFQVKNGNQFTMISTNLGNSAYNGVVLSGDSGIIYSDASAFALNSKKGFVIAPHKGGTSGIRMDGSGVVTFASPPVSTVFSVNNNNSTAIVYNPTAISAPPTINGIGIGTGDGSSETVFNTAIYSWSGIGFVDTCFKQCSIYMDVRTGGLSMKGGLNVTGNNNKNPGGVYFVDNTHSTFTYTSSSSLSTSIYAVNSVWSSQSFVVSSDERIKKNIIDIDDVSALEILRKIQPKIYNYKDILNRGNEPVWGFIAQQIKSVLNYCVSEQTEKIPNIYDIADVSGNIITLKNVSTNLFNSFDPSGNSYYNVDGYLKLILIDETNKKIEVYLTEIIDDKSFRIKDELSITKCFVYGQEINDFHVVDKNAIFTIATAALQEVDRELQETKINLQNVNDELQTAKQQINSQQIVIDELINRITALENK